MNHQALNHDASARTKAYDKHYRALWHSCEFTRQSIEARLAYFLDVSEGGNVNGNEIQYALRELGVPDVAGMRILDYCCGTGVTAIYLAMLGAQVWAFDRSPAAIEIARQSAQRSGVGNAVCFSVVDAQRLPYDEGAFHAIFCQSALHIVTDYPVCSTELARVLKPGGKAVFCEEALGYNPVIEGIRWIRRRKYRECGGRPLRYEDIQAFGRGFATTRVQHFNLLAQMKTLFGGQVRHGWVRGLLRAAERLDRRILAVAPCLERYCGKVVVEYVR